MNVSARTERRSGRYDLGAEPWIPVFPAGSGPVRHVGFVELLADAHRFRDIAFPADPLKWYAMLRYLFALGYLMYAEVPDPGRWRDVAREGAPFPEEAVEAVIDRCAGGWWLYHPERPFMQLASLPEFSNKIQRSGVGLADAADPFTVLLPNVPAKSNKLWHSKPDGASELPQPSEPELAAGLMVRHLFATAGNEAPVRDRHGDLIKNSSGGIGLYSKASVTHMVHVGPTVAATVAANLASSVVEGLRELSGAPSLFFDDPLHPERHLTDPVYRFGASGAASLLVPGRPELVLRGPMPFGRGHEVLQQARLYDPHTLKRRKRARGGPPAKLADVTFMTIDPAAPMFERLQRLFRNGLPSETLLCEVLDRDRMVVRTPASFTTTAVTVDVAGTASNALIDGVSREPFEVRYLALGSLEAQEDIAALLGRLGDVRKAVYGTIRRVLAGAQDDLVGRLSSRATRQMWQHMETSLAGWADEILAGTAPPLDDVFAQIRSGWTGTIVKLVRAQVEPYATGAHQQMVLERETSKLGGRLWSMLT